MIRLVRDILLRHAFFYDSLQYLLGSYSYRKKVVLSALAAREGVQTVLDIGCGTAETATWLPGNKYMGIDISPAYIKKGRERGLKEVTLIIGEAQNIDSIFSNQKFDIIFLLGVLHHLPFDDCKTVLANVSHLLNDYGVLVGIETATFDGQSSMSRYLTNLDRGRNILTGSGWARLLEEELSISEFRCDDSSLTIPFGMVSYSCRKKGT